MSKWFFKLKHPGSVVFLAVFLLGSLLYGIPAVIAIQAGEPFGNVIGDWKAQALPEKLVRLTCCLADAFWRSGPIPDNIYCQPINVPPPRLSWAERPGTAQAAKLVDSFSPTNRWPEDYQAFVTFFETTAEVVKPASVKARNCIRSHPEWIHGDERFLNAA